jgi:hypothetical protein
VWVDADYWFGPDGGVTVMMYRGTKDQNQTSIDGNSTPFTYRPAFYRAGVFGNYLFFDKLDILGGLIHSNDDYKWNPAGPTTNYTANTYRGEADYYFKPGTVIMARLDRGTARILPQPTMHTHAWSIGAERALTPLGNVVLRASYNQEHDGDPLALVGSTDKLFKLDFRFMW